MQQNISIIRYPSTTNQMFLMQPLTLKLGKVVSVKYGLGSSYFNFHLQNQTRPYQEEQRGMKTHIYTLRTQVIYCIFQNLSERMKRSC
jgi:hypothetical protein